MEKHVYSLLAQEEPIKSDKQHTQRYCTVHHTDEFLVFPGDLVRDTFAPVGEIWRIDKSL